MAIMIAVLLAACSTYEIKDGGDGVYYAESPPDYTYVYSWGWPSWYSSYYYPYYSSCWYAPYTSYFCGWGGIPYSRYSYFMPVYYGDFAFRDVPDPRMRKKRIKPPQVPDEPFDPWRDDQRSLKYSKNYQYASTKPPPAKSRSASTGSAYGKSTMKASPTRSSIPKGSSRSTSSSRKSSSISRSAKTTVPKNLD